MPKAPNPKSGRAATTRIPAEWDGLVREAERRGYLEFHGSRIRYKCAQVKDKDYDRPEERVRAGVYAWLILDREYSAAAIKIEVTVPRRTPSDFADIVVFTDETCRTPFLVVEAKEPYVTQPDLRQAVEQAFGNANSLRDTKLALVDSGAKSVLYAVADYPHDERRENLLGTRDGLPKAYGAAAQFSIIAGDGERDIRPHTSAEVEQLVRRAHGLIWAGGKRDPLTAFDEWAKLLFAKVYDERHTANGDPRRFQVGQGEQAITTGNRVRELYRDARMEDPSIFSEDLNLPDEKIAEVVRVIQPIAFTHMDVDALGNAFEGFFGSIFRGELGQYFTRREIVRFVCALLEPNDRDKVLDPTAGSGGFLLETLMQVWHHIDEAFAGQRDQERRKYDFAQNSLYGIEIHEKLGRICQTNLMLHRDGHTNIEVDRSCLDTTFRNAFLDPEEARFTLVVGNPPFGDEVKEGDRDLLGNNRLDNFELATGRASAQSEIVILERALKWLAPGRGRLGMVVPDGLLNNSGEISGCPAFRRFLFRNAQILAIVSLPDHAFRKSGAQNKTSLLFARRFSAAEKDEMDRSIAEHAQEFADPDSVVAQDEAIGKALGEHGYSVFLAEAERIGFSPAGLPNQTNELYHRDGTRVVGSASTVLGQYREFARNADDYRGSDEPHCIAIGAHALYQAHPTRRIDPKYHIFKHVEEMTPPRELTIYTLGQLLEVGEETIVPYDSPDREFRTITLTQEGRLKPREAGKGKYPPAWQGAYFPEGQKWYVVHVGGIILSRIDLWKGCIAVIPEAFEGGIVTNEFPVYYVRPEHRETVDVRYLQLLLRTRYFQRAIRAITTGHSNRRRTQEADFEALRVFLPDITTQRRIVEAIGKVEQQLSSDRGILRSKLAILDDVLLTHISTETLNKLLA